MSASAEAQVSGSVSLVSNYLYRGVSLSGNNPEAQLNLNADFDSGWFAGLFASPVDLSTAHAQTIAYGGYARQLNADLSWEAGLAETAYSDGGTEDYTEAFVGLSSDRLSGRLYYSPDYLGQSVHSVYGELNANLPLTSDIRLIAHAGYLSVQQGNAGAAASHDDTRVGLSYRTGDWSLQWSLASVRATTVNAYSYPHTSQRYIGVFDAAWNF